MTQAGNCGNPSHVHRFRKGHGGFVWVAPRPNVKRPGIVRRVVRDVFLLEDGVVTVALARRVLRIIRKGSDRDILKLLQFVDDRVDSEPASGPFPAVFVRSRDGEASPGAPGPEANRADRKGILTVGGLDYEPVN